MERPPKMRSHNKKSLFKFVTFQNPPFSPTRDSNPRSSSSELFNKFNAAKSHARRGSFSGPIVPLVPKEARLRRKSKNDGANIDTPQEPTSPKVSCMGQIKHKHKNKIKKKKKTKGEERARVREPSCGWSSGEEKKPKSRIFGRIFSGARAEAKTGLSGVPTENRREGGTERVSEERAPSLGQMRRFASSRNALADFDWTAQVAPADAAEHRNCHSDDEDRDREGGVGYDDEEAMIPFSAPILVGGGVELKAKKEVNLWKRRTMAPPQPLRLQHAH